MIDVIVIGAGIAGASSAFILQQRGFKVLLLEKGEICQGGSAAAGAFLSPKISKPSPYKTYLNDALKYTLAFYQNHFPDLLQKNGLLKLPLDSDDIKRCQSYEAYIDFLWEKKGDSYFFPEAGIIPVQPLCKALLKNIDLEENFPVNKIVHNGELWHINDTYSAKSLIFATGDSKEPFSLPYLQSKNIGGYRYDVHFEGYEKQNCNIHKDVSVSTAMKEYVIVGATHIKGDIDLEEAAQNDSYSLLEKAAAIVPMPEAEILAYYTGYRRFSFDYFPFVGPLVDEKKTLEHYPFITSGARVPLSKYHYYPNLYIHTALGSRGFVFAPYNAALLADFISHQKEINPHLLPASRFQKWARKQLQVV